MSNLCYSLVRCLSVAMLLPVAGCVTVPVPKPLVTDATSLLGRPFVSPWGRNWKVSWLAESDGQRFELYTAATDCDSRSGLLFVDGAARFEPSKHVVFRGSKPEDRLFTRLCSTGMPMVYVAQQNRPPQAPSTSSDELDPASRAILMQHLLNQAMPPPPSETRCERVPYSRTNEVVCTTR